MNGFWSNLPKPFFALAPLEDVTDAAFRRLIAKYSKYGGVEVVNKEGKFTHPHATLVGGPDVMFTEFTSADGLLFAEGNGKKKILKKLSFKRLGPIDIDGLSRIKRILRHLPISPVDHADR